MFRNSYQGGISNEIFSAQGSASTIMNWKLSAHNSIKRLYEKDAKGYCYNSSKTGKFTFPKDEKQSAYLINQFLILQVFIPLGEHVLIELSITDLNNNKRRFIVSSWNKETKLTALHVMLPMNLIKRSVWLNLCFDLVSFVTEFFRGQTFRSLDNIQLSGAFKLRKIFMMKDKPADTTGEWDFSNSITTTEQIPKNLNFNFGVEYLTQVMTAERFLTENPLNRPSNELEISRIQSGCVSHKIAFGRRTDINLPPIDKSATRISTTSSSKRYTPHEMLVVNTTPKKEMKKVLKKSSSKLEILKNINTEITKTDNDCKTQLDYNPQIYQEEVDENTQLQDTFEVHKISRSRKPSSNSLNLNRSRKTSTTSPEIIKTPLLNHSRQHSFDSNSTAEIRAKTPLLADYNAQDYDSYDALNDEITNILNKGCSMEEIALPSAAEDYTENLMQSKEVHASDKVLGDLEVSMSSPHQYQPVDEENNNIASNFTENNNEPSEFINMENGTGCSQQTEGFDYISNSLFSTKSCVVNIQKNLLNQGIDQRPQTGLLTEGSASVKKAKDFSSNMGCDSDTKILKEFKEDILEQSYVNNDSGIIALERCENVGFQMINTRSRLHNEDTKEGDKASPTVSNVEAENFDISRPSSSRSQKNRLSSVEKSEKFVLMENCMKKDDNELLSALVDEKREVINSIPPIAKLERVRPKSSHVRKQSKHKEVRTYAASTPSSPFIRRSRTENFLVRNIVKENDAKGCSVMSNKISATCSKVEKELNLADGEEISTEKELTNIPHPPQTLNSIAKTRPPSRLPRRSESSLKQSKESDKNSLPLKMSQEYLKEASVVEDKRNEMILEAILKDSLNELKLISDNLEKERKSSESETDLSEYSNNKQLTNQKFPEKKDKIMDSPKNEGFLRNATIENIKENSMIEHDNSGEKMIEDGKDVDEEDEEDEDDVELVFDEKLQLFQDIKTLKYYTKDF
ncbi:hypothetical protein HK099_001437 [Clydaea vesicula]|uniref:CFA20 domain-containing protein n=1 Tax=Clydaea vesicula TaxID=447962 RepID=A0AAD5XX77_9FUNG|nr:hypothetical protein HK099_001437 [Clydaea vesicula]